MSIKGFLIFFHIKSLKLLSEFLLAINSELYAFFRIVPKVVAPSNRGEDDVAEFFLEFMIGMKTLVFYSVAFPSTDIAEYFSHTDNNLIES